MESGNVEEEAALVVNDSHDSTNVAGAVVV
jgi:hypothetical protein